MWNLHRRVDRIGFFELPARQAPSGPSYGITTTFIVIAVSALVMGACHMLEIGPVELGSRIRMLEGKSVNKKRSYDQLKGEHRGKSVCLEFLVVATHVMFRL